MSPRTLLSSTALALFVLFPFTTAHNEQQPLSEDWATKHMQSEHHITSFEPNAFFAMHDFDADGYWEAPEIRRTYGLAPGSTNGVGGPGAEGNPNEEKKQEVESKVLNDFDIDGDGKVSRQEWGTAWGNGKRLKDFGVSISPPPHQKPLDSDFCVSNSWAPGIIKTMRSNMNCTITSSSITSIQKRRI